MMISPPPAIFSNPIDEDVVIEKKTKDGKVEKYATFFRRRQAYVGIPLNHPWAKKRCEDINCGKAHGGLTWSDSKLCDEQTRDGMWFIGWDYNHSDAMSLEWSLGMSYGETYDAMSKDLVITEANEVMKEAIAAMVE